MEKRQNVGTKSAFTPKRHSKTGQNFLTRSDPTRSEK